MSVRIKPGMVFERLTVVSKADKINLRPAWNCVCSCGTGRIILAQSLKLGVTKSCGCLHREIIVGKFKEKAGEQLGKQFGKWVVTDLLPRRAKNGGVYFLCRCECGAVREVSSDSLFNGRSKSCGNCGVKVKPVCKMGHIVADWGGRSPSGSCKACVKHKSLLRNYGITLVEYLAIGEFQGWKCAICDKPLDRVSGLPGFGRSGRAELDHQHAKEVDRKYARGVLCGGRWSGCNRKIGRIDDIVWLMRVVHYLQYPPAKAVLGT